MATPDGDTEFGIPSVLRSAPPGEVTATLMDRQPKYGKFVDNAATAQAIKAAMHAGRNWVVLSSDSTDVIDRALDADMQEALDVIATKIARILTGDPTNYDSWHDIAGYATLVADRLHPTNPVER